MHINVSVVQLVRSEVVDQIIALCEQIQAGPQRIVIEVTESAIHSLSTRKQLNRLQEIGFQVAIDDFGVRYSSFQEFKVFTYDMVKLDNSMMNSEGNCHRTNALLENLIRLFNVIDAPVLVEGFETEDHLHFCRDINCQYMQGYFFAKPMCANDLAKYITNFKLKEDSETSNNK